jgi:hypothetical protein
MQVTRSDQIIAQGKLGSDERATHVTTDTRLRDRVAFVVAGRDRARSAAPLDERREPGMTVDDQRGRNLL